MTAVRRYVEAHWLVDVDPSFYANLGSYSHLALTPLRTCALEAAVGRAINPTATSRRDLIALEEV
jgi:hypothetical protein